MRNGFLAIDAPKYAMVAFVLIFFVCMWKLAGSPTSWREAETLATQIAGFSPNSEKAQGVVFPRQQKIHAKLIDYRNHKYIVFTLFSVSRGVVHDPDCPCQTVD